jgi:hypothetical protein
VAHADATGTANAESEIALAPVTACSEISGKNGSETVQFCFLQREEKMHYLARSKRRFTRAYSRLLRFMKPTELTNGLKKTNKKRIKTNKNRIGSTT